MDVALPKPKKKSKKALKKEALLSEVETEARHKEDRSDLTLGPVWGLHCRIRTYESSEDASIQIDKEIEDCKRAYLDSGFIDADAVLSMCREIKREEENVERIEVESRVLIDRAKRRLTRTRQILWPTIDRWSQTAKRTTPKSIAFQGSTLRLQWRKSQGKVIVTDSRSAVEDLLQTFGTAKSAEANGVIRIKEEVSLSGLRAWMEGDGAEERIDMDTGECLTQIPNIRGVRYESPGNKLYIR